METIRVTVTYPEELKWDEIGADVVAEATGCSLLMRQLGHITAGPKVVLTGPSKDATPMFVGGCKPTHMLVKILHQTRHVQRTA